MASKECLYTLKETPYGHGLFAQADVKPGTRIIQDEPIMTVSSEEVKLKPEEAWVTSKLGQLPTESQNQLMELYHNPKKLQDFNHLQGKVCPSTDLDCALVLAKFYTNAASLASGGLRVGLFPTFCRMNHSCTPNTCWVYDELSGMMEVYAVRQIKQGEELTDSYTEVARSKAGRNKELSNWGFQCGCEACEGPKATEIDVRRRRIAKIRQLVELYEESQKDGKPIFSEVPKTNIEALELAEEAVTLLSEEQLVEELGVAHGWCVKFARAAGLKDLAESHEDKEFDILVLTTGECID